MCRPEWRTRRQRFGIIDVEHGAGEPTFAQSIFKSGVINETGAPNIDKSGATLHQSDPSSIYEQLGLRGQRCRRQDEVGKGQDLIKIVRPEHLIDATVSSAASADAQDTQSKFARSLRGSASHVADADDQHCLSTD